MSYLWCFIMNDWVKKLLLILLLICPLYVQGKIFVALVEISEYGQSYKNLTYCHQDAIDMYNMLKEYTTPERIILLTDKQAKHDNIVYYTKRLFSQAQPEDMVIFFFSGQGNTNVFLRMTEAYISTHYSRFSGKPRPNGNWFLPTPVFRERYDNRVIKPLRLTRIRGKTSCFFFLPAPTSMHGKIRLLRTAFLPIFSSPA